jgi:hypothetical protein
MSNPKNLSPQVSDDISDYPLKVQFSARMAILNAQMRAKITDGTYKPKIIKDRIPSHAIPPDYHLHLKRMA